MKIIIKDVFSDIDSIELSFDLSKIKTCDLVKLYLNELNKKFTHAIESTKYMNDLTFYFSGIRYTAAELNSLDKLLSDIIKASEIENDNCEMYVSFQAKTDLFNKFISHMFNDQETDALNLLNKIVFIHGNEFFNDRKILLFDNLKNEVIANSLYVAAMRGYKSIVCRLLDLDMPVNEGVICSGVPSYHNDTPLMIACANNYKEIVEILLSSRVHNLLNVTGTGRNILMEIKSCEILKLILDEAKKQNCLNQLMSIRDQDNKIALQHESITPEMSSMLYREDLKLLNNYINIKDEDNVSLVIERLSINFGPQGFNGFITERFLEFDDGKMSYLDQFILRTMSKTILKCCDLGMIIDRNSLHHLRHAAWRHINEKQKIEYEDLCIFFRKKAPKRDASELKDNPFLLFSDAYQRLFNEDIFSASRLIDNTENAIKIAIADFYQLLNMPNRCIKYLKFLNNELDRYFHEKYAQPFPKLNSKSYHFTSIDGTYFPIPNAHYNKLLKHHALQEYLVSLFKKYGLAENAFKWIGFIPHEIANEMVKKGDMITESRLGEGLFHNKLAHMLQRAILIYAIKNGEVRLRGISIKEVFSALVSWTHAKDQESKLWMPVLDTRVFPFVVFTDPHRLGSTIMINGKKWGIRALSDSLIDTFCRGITHLINAFRSNIHFSQLDLDQFVDMMQDVETRLFGAYPLHVTQYAIQREIEKKVIDNESDILNSKYACIPKFYDVKKDFKPRSFNSKKYYQQGLFANAKRDAINSDLQSAHQVKINY